MRKALRLAIKSITALADENKSVWEMIDEMKASDIKNHKELLKSEIETVVDGLHTLVVTKIGEA